MFAYRSVLSMFLMNDSDALVQDCSNSIQWSNNNIALSQRYTFSKLKSKDILMMLYTCAFHLRKRFIIPWDASLKDLAKSRNCEICTENNLTRSPINFTGVAAAVLTRACQISKQYDDLEYAASRLHENVWYDVLLGIGTVPDILKWKAF